VLRTFPFRRGPCCAAFLLAVAGCGSRGSETAAAPSPEEIRNLMKGNVVQEAPPPPLRLGVLADAEIAPRFREKPLCRLRQGDKVLLVAKGKEALARVDGRVAVLAQGGPVDATGAFFRGQGITISIGGRDLHPIGAAPAGVTLAGGPPDSAPQKLEAMWGCTG
jgi:hypothetical protein